MSDELYATYIKTLQAGLQEKAVSQTKEWWEAYMKQVIPFRGVKMPDIRAVLHRWYASGDIEQTLSWAEQKALALALFREEYAEDKLAGILLLHEILLPAGAMECPGDLPRLAELFTQNLIYDWNICDWFCVKLLGSLIQEKGKPCARAIAAWSRADNLWQARCSVVAFVPVAAESSYYPLVQQSARALIRREERFAKTAVGWILRDISRHDEPFVKAFIEDQLEYFSTESLKNATKYFDKSDQSRYRRRLKSGRQG